MPKNSLMRVVKLANWVLPKLCRFNFTYDRLCGMVGCTSKGFYHQASPLSCNDCSQIVHTVPASVTEKYNTIWMMMLCAYACNCKPDVMYCGLSTMVWNKGIIISIII